MTEKINRGIIYLLTNTANGKIYIGQTKEYSGVTALRKYGLHNRWKDHVSSANRNTVKGCVLLNRAIRKYGEAAFTQDILVYCSIEDRDKIEIALIYGYDSNNPKYGYNVCTGGGGTPGHPITEEFRESVAQFNPTGIMNIKQIKSRKDKSIILGYKVSRDYDGKRYNKDFADGKYSLEENMNFAKEWLNELKNGNHIDNKHKKPDNLPIYIRYYYEPKTKEIGGYKIEIRLDGFYHSKCFTKKSLSMEEKLRLSIEHKDEILENLRKKQQESSKDDKNNQQPSSKLSSESMKEVQRPNVSGSTL
jgi:hypothetical protein